MVLKFCEQASCWLFPDMERATRYWCDVLGFQLQFSNEDWRLVGRDICQVMLGECPNAIAPSEVGDHSYFGYINVSDVDAYCTEINARGALVAAPPSDKSWGMREMSVKTPDGHRIRFGQRLEKLSTQGTARFMQYPAVGPKRTSRDEAYE
jgi:uncharacterized glyoxalase superfamily protein PhnB